MKPNSSDLKDVYDNNTNEVVHHATLPNNTKTIDMLLMEEDDATAKDVESKNKDGKHTPITPIVNFDKFESEQKNLLVGKETLDLILSQQVDYEED